MALNLIDLQKVKVKVKESRNDMTSQLKDSVVICINFH